MKKILCLLLIIGTALAMSAYNTESAMINFTLTAHADGASMRVHVPINTPTQTVTQQTDLAVKKDAIGEYILVSGDTTYKAIVEVDTSSIEITSNPLFPIDAQGYETYLAQTDNIKPNDAAIKSKAQELTQETNTELEAIAAVTEWVYEEMQYEETEQGTPGVISAELVIHSKTGVCGEYSVLAASMLRSLGIPTKYVEGFVYTGEEFLPHAWLEAYVPGTGWIAVDPTNGVMGVVPATLVKVIHGLDPLDLHDTIFYSESSADYNREHKLEVIDYDNFDNLFTSKLTLSPKHAGFGSYVIASLALTNLQDYYLTPLVELQRSEGIEVDDPSTILVLAPDETANVQWKFITPDNLDKNYKYTFFLATKGQGISETENLTVSMQSDAVHNPLLDVFAEAELAGDQIVITVDVTNNGNEDIDVLEVSAGAPPLGTQHQTIHLPVDDSKQLKYYFIAQKGVTSQTFTVLASFGSTQVTKYVNVQVPQQPGLLKSSTSTGNVFILALIIITVIVAAIFIYPLIKGPKRPFREVTTLEDILKK